MRGACREWSAGLNRPPNPFELTSTQFGIGMRWNDPLLSNLFTVINRRQRRLPRPTVRARWWTPACVAILFAFHLNYVPVHLATDLHVSKLFSSLTHLVVHGHHHGGKETEENHHVPHPASDHALELAVRNPSPSDHLDVFLLPVDMTPQLFEHSPTAPLPLLERIKLPGESPPSPLQPRAPPLA